MEIHAVTVCFRYADFLAQTLRNGKHFDSWTIVSSPADTDTHEFCRVHGLRCVITDLCGDWGEAFDSAYAKAPVLNAGLEKLRPGPGVWAAIVDADLLLPADFRERVEGIPLYSRALYGLAGRRETVETEAYEMRMPVEPWDEFSGSNENILGFFQMFRLDQQNCRYPLRREEPHVHEDIGFQYLFKPTMRRFLPMMGLHVGPPRVNWGGRQSTALAGGTALPSGELPMIARCFRTERMLVAGFDSTTDFEGWNRACAGVVWCDWHGIHLPGIVDIEEQDRVVRRRLTTTRGGPTAESTEPASPAGVAKLIGEGDSTCIFLNHEHDVEHLLWWAERIYESGRPLALAGRFYSLPAFTNSAVALAAVFGKPARVERDGTWLIPAAQVWEHVSQLCRRTVRQTPEVLMCVRDKLDAEIVMHHLRHWPEGGPQLAVYCSALNLPLLSLHCRRAGASFVEWPPEDMRSLEGPLGEFLSLASQLEAPTIRIAPLECLNPWEAPHLDTTVAGICMAAASEPGSPEALLPELQKMLPWASGIDLLAGARIAASADVLDFSVTDASLLLPLWGDFARSMGGVPDKLRTALAAAWVARPDLRESLRIAGVRQQPDREQEATIVQPLTSVRARKGSIVVLPLHSISMNVVLESLTQWRVEGAVEQYLLLPENSHGLTERIEGWTCVCWSPPELNSATMAEILPLAASAVPEHPEADLVLAPIHCLPGPCGSLFEFLEGCRGAWEVPPESADSSHSARSQPHPLSPIFIKTEDRHLILTREGVTSFFEGSAGHKLRLHPGSSGWVPIQ